MDEKKLRETYREIAKSLRDAAALRGLTKNEHGRLTDAGKALVREGYSSGMSQATIARLLEITPAAVHYHVKW